MDRNKVFHGDCLEVMRDIPDGSVDMILCDLPYGVTTKNKWDVVIPPEQLWERYGRIIKPNGAIILFGQDKFTARMMLSKPEWHRYNLIWKKVLPSGFLNANRQPLREHEDLMVFYKNQPTYHPQKKEGASCHKKGKAVGVKNDSILNNHNYGDFNVVETEGNMKFPTSILEFSKPHPSIAIHPTQKPVALCEYLIRAYTNEGETVLDNCAGSGTTGVACQNTGRNYILIEKEQKYIDIIKTRLEDNAMRMQQNTLF
jgi:site-specific DNA-methyltransferase (adenine-specific)